MNVTSCAGIPTAEPRTSDFHSALTSSNLFVPLFSGYHFAKFLPCPRVVAYNCTFTFDRERDWRTPRFMSQNSLHQRKGRRRTRRRRRILPSHFVAATRLQAEVSSDWCSNLRHRFLLLLEAVSKQTTLARRHRYPRSPPCSRVRFLLMLPLFTPDAILPA